MSKHARNLIVLLCFLMLFSCVFTSCAEKKDPNREEYKRAEGGREGTPDSLPDDINFKGYKYEVFYRAGEWVNYYECEGFNEEGASAVYTTVYERNERVCSRLNCNIEWVPSANGGLAETKSEISNHLLRLDYYDAILTTNNTCLHLGRNASLCELRDAEYIDYDQPWWWNDVIDELSYDGFTINFLVGDMNLINFQKMSAMYFNYDLIQSMLQMTPQDFYRLVDDKEWTIERFNYLSKKCFKDQASAYSVTGPDDGDLYGFNWVGGETVEQFIYSTKILDTLYTRRGNGLVDLNLEGNEMIVDLVTVLQKLFHENEGARNMTGKLVYDSTNIQEFANGNTVFLPQRLTAACSDYLREMETDYGIIPYPLLEEGDDYRTWIQDSSTSICIPQIVEDTSIEAFDRSCILLEALCSEAYRYTTVAFFDNALKNKYTRDDDAARMVDIIYNTASKNFLVEYTSCANGIRSEIYNAINSNDSVTTRFASKVTAAQNALNKFIVDTAEQFS